jgi:hypothetical protein
MFCRYGEVYRQQHGASLSTAQRRVMTRSSNAARRRSAAMSRLGHPKNFKWITIATPRIAFSAPNYNLR